LQQIYWNNPIQKVSVNYNKLAPFYGFISEIVFGKALTKSTAVFMDRIPENAKILVAGGGDGKILKDLFKTGKKFNILYCDSSNKMLNLAKKRDPFPSGQVDFLCKDAFTLNHQDLDCVITPFFLDQFSNPDIERFLEKCHSYTSNSGMILFTDFNKNPHGFMRHFHRLLIKSMYYFFALVVGLKQRTLPDFLNCFENTSWKLAEKWESNNGLLTSAVFRKM
jgi:tRNA (cmo5U34)-methyltransferase